MKYRHVSYYERYESSFKLDNSMMFKKHFMVAALCPLYTLSVFVLGGIMTMTSTLTALPVYANSDFNGDGRDDLAIGVPGESVGDKPYAGAVKVPYGTSSRLSSTGDQIWTQDSSGVEGATTGYESFGLSLANGDFNGDGRMDLAIGSTFDKVGTVVAAGAVNVLYGSVPAGLTSSNNQVWTQDSSGLEGAAEDSDRFGWALSRDS